MDHLKYTYEAADGCDNERVVVTHKKLHVCWFSMPEDNHDTWDIVFHIGSDEEEPRMSLNWKGVTDKRHVELPASTTEKQVKQAIEKRFEQWLGDAGLAVLP